MSIVLDVPPELEDRLQAEAQRKGQRPDEFVLALLKEQLTPKEVDLDAFLKRPRTEQDLLLQAAAERAAPFYAADLALPIAERELTAFTALDTEDFLDAS
jgi:hypothetical protein